MSEWPIVDSVQFARTNGELRVSAPISDFERLINVVLEGSDEVDARLEGFQDSESRPCLRLRVKGSIRVACQRCLEALPIELATDRDFILVEREDEMQDLADEGDSVESLLADSKLDVKALVEDEVLLQLPMAPTHEPDACTAPEWATQNKADDGAFGVLGALTRAKE
jgi:uncharacterized protein